MFQTLRPQRGNLGEVEYVVSSSRSEPNHLRKSRTQPACSFCRAKKLRCRDEGGESCDQCLKQGITCSYMYINKSELTTDHEKLKQPEEEDSPKQQNHRQLQQESDSQDPSELDQPNVTGNNSTGVYGPNTANMTIGVHPLVDTFLNSIDPEGFDPYYDNFDFLNPYQNDDDENQAFSSSLSPSYGSNDFLDQLQKEFGRSISTDAAANGIALDRENDCAQDFATSPTTTLSRRLSPKNVRTRDLRQIEFSKMQQSAREGIVSEDGGSSCKCINLLLSSHERLQVQIVWPLRNKMNNNKCGPDHNKHHNEVDSTCKTDSTSGVSNICIEDILECQRCVLLSIEVVLSCDTCSYRSDHVMFCLSICKEMVRTVRELHDGTTAPIMASPMPSSKDDSVEMNKEAKVGEQRGGNDADSISAPLANNSAIKSERWFLDEQTEMQVVWRLVELRTARLGKLVHHLADVALKNELACSPFAQALRRQLGHCAIA